MSTKLLRRVVSSSASASAHTLRPYLPQQTRRCASTLASQRGGDLYAWGKGGAGQIGPGLPASSSTTLYDKPRWVPDEIEGVPQSAGGASAVSAGDVHTLLLKKRWRHLLVGNEQKRGAGSRG